MARRLLASTQGFENLTGSFHGDTLLRTAASNTIHDGSGSETIGTGGATVADVVYGDPDNDFYFANNAGDIRERAEARSTI